MSGKTRLGAAKGRTKGKGRASAASALAARKRAGSPSRQARLRLSPDSREKLILDGAIQYFAEVGLSGQTRQLAERLGITQPLVYRYFPTKRVLIDSVFDAVFVKYIDDQWLFDLSDGTQPLVARLREFYTRYASLVCRYEWIRIYLFASLLDQRRGCEDVQTGEDAVLRHVCEAIRIDLGLPSVNVIPISDLELEQLWLLHSGLYYYAIRKFVYRSRVHENLQEILARNVDIVLAGIRSLVVDGERSRKDSARLAGLRPPKA